MERFGRLCDRVLRCMEKDLSVTFTDLLVSSVCFASAKFLYNRPWLKASMLTREHIYKILTVIKEIIIKANGPVSIKVDAGLFFVGRNGFAGRFKLKCIE